MAYLQSGLNVISSGANTFAPRLLSFKSTTDALATIVASAYFNGLVQDLTNGVGSVKIGDIIYCQGSDSQAFTRVTAVTTNVTVSQFADISSIADGELTAAMTALAQGSLMLGNASGYGSALDVSTSGVIVRGNGTTGVAVAGPSHLIRFAGQPTTGGGAAAEAITVTGAAATDYAFVQMVDDGTNNTTIVNAVVTTNTLTVTFSGDPGADAVINYQIVRAIV